MTKRTVGLFSVALLLLLSACAGGPSGGSPFSTRFVDANERAAPQEIKRSGEDGVLRVTVLHALKPDGPGAWVRGAEWDEYVLRIENLSASVITVDSIAIADIRGVLIPREFHAEVLRQKSAMLKSEYASVGAIAAGKVAADAALYGGMAAAALFPPAAIVAGGAALVAMSSKQKDQNQIASEFTRRNIPLVASVDTNGTLQGSAFFPVMPPPRALVVQYRNSQGMPVPVRIDLSGSSSATEAAATTPAK